MHHHEEIYISRLDENCMSNHCSSSAAICFVTVASQQNGEVMRIFLAQAFTVQPKHIYKAGITSDISVICHPVICLALGGREDYRQNSAESHQSTEGESLFYGHMVTLKSWLQCS